MTINEPLLRKAVEWVEWQENLPDIDREWDQSIWAIDADDRARSLAENSVCEYPDYAQTTGRVDEERTGALAEQLAPYCGTAYCVAGYIGQLQDERYRTSDTVDGVHVALFAARELGVYDGDSAHRAQCLELFNGGNSAEQIRHLAEELVGHAL